MEYKYIDNLQSQQRVLVKDFMDSLKKDDIELFWSTLSKEDKAYTRGVFNISSNNGEDFSFEGFKQEIFISKKEHFINYIDNYGLSTSVRHYNKMLADVYLPHGVKVSTTYIAEADVRAMKLPIVLEIHLSEDEELSLEWRVSLFTNTEL